MRALCWKGIPPAVRGLAWQAIIGNELKITRGASRRVRVAPLLTAHTDLYHILLDRALSTPSTDLHADGHVATNREST